MPDDQASARPGAAVPGISSGVPGLDEVLGGGFPLNMITLITGGPGTGKTSLGLQFLVAGARQGEQGLYLALSETAGELRSIAASYGMSLDGIEIEEVLAVHEAAPGTTLFQAGEIELSDAADRIVDRIERIKPRRVVLDFVSALRRLFSDDLHFQRYLVSLKRLAQQGITVLLIEAGEGDLYLRVFAHGVLELQQLCREYGRIRRRLAVAKLRGAAYASGYHDFSIHAGGLTVYPCVAPSLKPEAPDAHQLMPSSLPEFDSLLGGGLRCGSSALLLGASGTGKSVMAAQFATAAALRGERALIFLVDELYANYVDRSRGVGMETDRALATGRLRVERVNAAAISPGEFARKAIEAVDRDGVRLIVLDSVGGYMQAMCEERALILQMHEMLAALAERNVLTLLLLTETGILGSAVAAPVYMSYFSDAIIVFRFFEMQGEIRRCVAVFKKRYGQHESTIRELRIEPGRLSIGSPLRELKGVMTGVPAYGK